VDEFQDTSAEQNSLMCKLVAGWQEGDGRTLFIVGDPMQSIYRFREAEVGNFLQAWKGRLGEVRLNPVHLTVNFRSTHGVVDWVNRTFVKVFPAVDNIEKGAVAYSPAVAFSSECAPAVQGHWTLNQTAENEAEAMLNLVQQRLAEWAELKVNNVNEPQKQSASMAILGRSRASLMGIARRLKAAHIAFKAVELENLAERQEVQDVLALSRALLHLADRPAWIALLRSPLVGLSLADLYALMGDAPYKLQQTVWHLLSPRNDQAWSHDGLSFHGLSSEGQSRLNDALPILHTALQRVGSVGFSTLVRETWLQLDGAQTVENAVALDNVQVFFDTLAGLDGEALEFSQLDSLLADLYAKADARPESQQIELMTMHKSKGLEFDTVILPGLGRKPRANDHQLVSWFAFLDDTGPLAPLEQLVIAPIDQKGQGASGLSQLLKRFENQKQDYELARLFYVACTRAKRQLHLFGSVPFQLSANRETAEGSGFVDTLKPPSSSLLAPLWSCVAADFMALATAFEPAPMAEMAQKPIIKISRLPLNRPRFTHTAQAKANHADTSQTLNKTAQALHTISPGLVSPESLMSHELLNTEVGKLVHKVLEHVVAEGLAHWPLNGVADRLMARQPIYAQWLTKQGVNRDLPLALARVQQSLLHALTHPLVRWALANHWVESATELSLVSAEPFESADQATEVMQVSPVSLHVVDRTFVDDADTRWIVDYKTSAFSGQWSALALPERQAFLTSKVEQYRPQLARYGALFRQVEHRPQKWVLYFSDLNEWVELEQALHE
jgi:ATP-dependent exoDNAse (exonuclease V) beta subunit